MQIDVTQSIRKLLDQRRPVGIDGVGTIELVNLSAAFGEKRESILPPSVDLKLNPKISSNDELISLIAKDYNISKSKASDVVALFDKRINDALINYGKVNLLGLCLISKNQDGQYVLQADEAFVSQYYKGLPEVPIKFIDRTKKKEVPAVSANIPETNGNDDSNEALNQILEKIQKEETKSDKSFIAPPPEVSEVFSVEDDSVQTESNEISWNQEAPTKRNYWIPILIGLGILLLMILGLKTCQWIKGDDIKKQDSLAKSAALEEEKADELASLEAGMPEEGAQALIEECIIITGVFASQTNTDRMVGLLEANGYVPYLESFGPYTRTGIRFACNDLDLEAYIRNVRTTIEKNSWYLNPQIYVEY